MRFLVVTWFPFLCAALRGAAAPKRITGDALDAVLAVGADAGVGIAQSGPRTVNVPNWQRLVRGAAPNVTWGGSALAFNRSSTEQKLNALVVEELVARRVAEGPATARRLNAATTAPPGWVYSDKPGVMNRAHRCQPAGDPAGKPENRSAIWSPFNKSRDLPRDAVQVCQVDFHFRCSDSPVCVGNCDVTRDPNLYYRCYRRKVCVNADCSCMCGPSWTTHPDCDNGNPAPGQPGASFYDQLVSTGGEAHTPPCDPPREFPRRFAGCCCEPCACKRDFASNRVDGCCTCKQCPPVNEETGEFWWSDGEEMQCLWAEDAVRPAPSLRLGVVALATWHVLTNVFA